MSRQAAFGGQSNGRIFLVVFVVFVANVEKLRDQMKGPSLDQFR